MVNRNIYSIIIRGGIILHIFVMKKKHFMDLNKETAMRLWGVFFGKNTNAVDYAGREIRKGAYNDRNSQFGWNVDHILPVSKGGKTADHNLICCHILTNDEKANSFPLFNANGQKFKIVKKQNHYEIQNNENDTKNKENANSQNQNPNKTKNQDVINFYDSADGIRLYKKLKGLQNKKRWVGYIAIRMKEINDTAVVEFIEQAFSHENIDYYKGDSNGVIISNNLPYYIYDLKILITCNIPYKDDLNLELDKCVLLNTYLNDYFLNNKLISSYEIIYCAYNYNDNKDLFINEKSIQQKVLKNLNSGWSYSLTNTLYINDLVKINIDDGPKVKDEDKKGDYYVYDYYFTKLSKNLRKESEE